MGKSQADRVKAVVFWLCGQTGDKQIEIANKLGINNKSYFSQILNGIAPVPSRLPAKIAALDPRINIDYMMEQSDDMLIKQRSEANSEEDAKPKHVVNTLIPEDLTIIIENMAATIRSQQELIAYLTKQTNSNK